ncbi:MAG: hypothetical protein ABEH40_03390 [Haloferacaceae archaeon]
MPSLAALAAELVGSAVRLVRIFLVEVALRDPLAFVSFAVGALLTTAAVAVLGYLAAGAALDAAGFATGSPGRGRRPRG